MYAEGAEVAEVAKKRGIGKRGKLGKKVEERVWREGGGGDRALIRRCATPSPSRLGEGGRGRKTEENGNRRGREGGEKTCFAEDGRSMAPGNGGEKSGRRSRRGEEEEKSGSPHPGPLPSEWEREEEEEEEKRKRRGKEKGKGKGERGKGKGKGKGEERRGGEKMCFVEDG
ncbi:MAG: hypothetical protein JKY43_04725 [Phycisphaerales bacterium]|nr:hypothetical protein [Phycisphaerales bacterium]